MKSTESSLATGLLAGLSILAMLLVANEFRGERVNMQPLSPQAIEAEARAITP